MRARGRVRDGHVAELLAGSSQATATRFATPRHSFRRFAWTGTGARLVLARLRCSRLERCGTGEGAELRMRRLVFALRDRVAPILGLGGPLLAPGSRRGHQQLTAVAGDTGGGVRRIVVQVNGDIVHAGALPCALTRDFALRLRPCPSPATTTVTAATSSGPFRQGPNDLRVCAFDYATATDANRDCESRRVRVDNACPLSERPGARLRARLRGHGGSATIARRQRATVVGRLADASGGAVAGARICLATRTRMPAAVERVVATPTTGPNGQFRIRVPSGPSRELRVAHWPSAESALERFLDLRVRARPGLRIRPDRRLQNGERAHFRVRLPGPRAGRRRVVLQAHANGRWIPVRNGRTDRLGSWRTSYRFRATTGARTYRFRALVPRQRGYPYLSGASEVRRQMVIG
jgi:hypothetical protein